MDDHRDNHRIDELEERYTHLDRLLQELSHVVWRQQRELDLLHEVACRLESKLAADPGLVETAREERPPHY